MSYLSLILDLKDELPVMNREFAMHAKNLIT